MGVKIHFSVKMGKCKNVRMRFLRYVLRELKWRSEVVIEELHLLWGETALCGVVPRGGETCREFGVGTSVTLGLKIADVGENNLRRVGRGCEN